MESLDLPDPGRCFADGPFRSNFILFILDNTSVADMGQVKFGRVM